MRRATPPSSLLAVVSLVLLITLVVAPWGGDVRGADHRDSPLGSEDQPADINDVYVFVSPADPNKVIFAMTVNGFAVPAVRSSYSFGPDVLYQFKIDTTGDAKEDLVIQATFDGFESLRDSRCPAPSGGQFVTVLGPARPSKVGNENFLLRRSPELTGCTNAVLGPSPDGIRAWAGLAQDPFVVDIAQLNRMLGGTQVVFRGANSSVLGALRGRPIRDDDTSGVDSFGGFNASALVIEVPIALILPARPASVSSLASSSNGGSHGHPGWHHPHHPRPPAGRGYLLNDTTIGVWGTTSRTRTQKLFSHKDPRDLGPYIQVQRMGHQVFKTVFVPSPSKDPFNRSIPSDDATFAAQFVPDALTSNDPDGNTIAARAGLLDAVGVATLPNGVPLLLPPTFVNTDKNLLRKVLIPDVLRIDLRRDPLDVGVASNGLQNGRRFNDDVIDILLTLARQLADVRFPPGVPGGHTGPSTRRALDCTVLPACPDRRVLAVLQGTDFIKPDEDLDDLSINGDDRPPQAQFPFIGLAHPLPGSDTPPPGTVGFPLQQ
jgi:hypothetical protein